MIKENVGLELEKITVSKATKKASLKKSGGHFS